MILSRILRVALLTAAGPAIAEPVAFQGLAFPDQIAGFSRGQSNNLERRHPGLGQATAYRNERWTATVYIYDLQRRDIPDDPLARPVAEQMRRARDDVQSLAASGHYQSATTKGNYRLPAQGRPRFQCGDIVIARDGATFDSLICVTSWRGKFVKFRLTGPQRNGTAEARRFVEAWTKILWP